jgi:hypothetical protein
MILKGYIARSTNNAKYIYCTNGQFEHEDYVGPGTRRSARVYKTRGGAEKVRGGTVTVEAYYE